MGSKKIKNKEKKIKYCYAIMCKKKRLHGAFDFTDNGFKKAEEYIYKHLNSNDYSIIKHKL